jgi:hypothetical protein
VIQGEGGVVAVTARRQFVPAYLMPWGFSRTVTGFFEWEEFAPHSAKGVTTAHASGSFIEAALKAVNKDI